jgi:signal transduction histidine kinase
VREAALAEDYAVQLERWLERGGKESLEGAYELARRAIDEGLGVIDMSELHQSALERALSRPGADLDPARALRIAKTFFAETLLPFEMAHRASRDSNASLRRLNERFEDDAKRISHAIHAETGQLLASAAIALERVGRELPEKREELRQVAALLDQIHHELRRLSHELRPPLLDQLGLLPALRFLAEGVSERSGITVRVYGDLPARPTPQMETAVYRIVQEALHNVIEHSGAARAMVRVWKERKSLHCSVRDGGNGFDARATAETGKGRGLGLVSIRERLHELGGRLKIDSAPGRGTDLVIMIPTED